MSISMVEPTGIQPTDEMSISVAVVDDSAVVRGLVSRWINEVPNLQVVGRYANGKLAVEQVADSRPDVIILDIEMPVMDGMTALPLLLKAKPGVKIIMASTLTKRNAEVSMRALSMGATDYIPKPEGNRGVTSSKDFRVALIKKIEAIGRKASPLSSASLRQRTEIPDARSIEKDAQASTPALRKFSAIQPRIVTIGSSTGGPQALMRVFGDIKQAISRVPVLITQHMPATFTAILAEHLARASDHKAMEGETGQELQPGCIYVAPGGHHMMIERGAKVPHIKIYDGPEVNFCKPAVDPLFESIASIYGAAVLALVLTGMGHDGTKGALAIADAGGSVIAQDEATSVVWGMPGSAAAAGVCAAILPIEKIGPKVSTILQGIRA